MLLLLAAAVGLADGVAAATGTPADSLVRLPGGKKLVEYGWDVPDPFYLREHIRQMEQQPFDGVVFRLREFNHAFDPRVWPEDELHEQLQVVAQIPWQRFTDNFLCLYAANSWSMDWSDDEQWRVIRANLRISARAARAARCVGICFDPEPYGPNPWLYPADADAAAQARLAAQVRRRGREFVAALQAELPTLRLLTLYGHSVFGDLATETDPDERQHRLAGHYYGLYLAFLEGILDGLQPEARLIDGNEPSYYYDSSEAFLRAYHGMRQTNAQLVARETLPRYRARMDAGMALYVDQVLGLRPPAGRFLSHYMRPEDQLRWFEHNVYWALRTTDEYVWCYSERLNWWTGDYPPGLDQAVATARAKLAGRGAAEFQLDAVLARGRAAMEEALAEQLVRREAAVAWLSDDAPPVIDGRLADACWERGALESLLPPVGADTLVASTTAWVRADTAALYVAIRCAEPAMDQVVAAGTRADDPLWFGDTVELFVSLGAGPEPYLHLIVNPSNARWDATSGGATGDASWNGQWRSATQRNADAWTVELAVPWSELGGRPQPGDRRYANVCRQRVAAPGELSSWSMVVQGFLEPEHFGQWEFGEQEVGQR